MTFPGTTSDTTNDTATTAAEIIRLRAPLDSAPSLAGQTFQGPWFVVAPDRIELFEQATYTLENHIVFPSDDYEEDLLEGYHLLALLDHLLNDLVAAEGQDWYPVNYGLDAVRFVTPVCAGDPIRATGTVVSIRPKGTGSLLELAIRVELEGAQRPAFVATAYVLWLPREEDAT